MPERVRTGTCSGGFTCSSFSSLLPSPPLSQRPGRLMGTHPQLPFSFSDSSLVGSATLSALRLCPHLCSGPCSLHTPSKGHHCTSYPATKPSGFPLPLALSLSIKLPQILTILEQHRPKNVSSTSRPTAFPLDIESSVSSGRLCSLRAGTASYS